MKSQVATLDGWLTESCAASGVAGDRTAASCYLVHVSTPDQDEAERLGEMAVQNRLAACAQVLGPVKSCYWWEGELLSPTEWLCTLITTTARLESLIDALHEVHSFKVPHIVATPIVAGAPGYLAWIDTETATEPTNPAKESSSQTAGGSNSL